MMLPVENYHLRTVDLGSGTPMLMHDGWVASWELWLPLIERLQHRWRCVAYDHRGAGASTFPPDAITGSALVDDVFRVLDAHGIDRAVIAGESLGGLVCQQAVLRDPSRFRGLILVGSSPRTPPQRDDAAYEFMRRDWPGHVAGFVAACLPEADARPLHRFGRGTLLPAGPEAGVQMYNANAGLALDVEAITIPALVVHGARDTIIPLERGRELARRIPGATLEVLDDAGHVPIITRPDTVALAIESWWSRVAASKILLP